MIVFGGRGWDLFADVIHMRVKGKVRWKRELRVGQKKKRKKEKRD